MVDTINPNTNEPDNLNATQGQGQPTVPENRFYGGFDKPDETKINLADSQPVSPSSAPPEVAPVLRPVSPQPVADVAPVNSNEVKHTSYVNSADAINWRGVMVIVLIGLVATALAGAGIYFGVSAMNKNKLAELEARQKSIEKELTVLSISPTPLELPVSETPATPSPVETPAPVVETPVVTPAPIAVPQVDEPSKEAGDGLA